MVQDLRVAEISKAVKNGKGPYQAKNHHSKAKIHIQQNPSEASEGECELGIESPNGARP